jgi:hypothetical protein
MKSNKDICVLYKDNTYEFISNTDKDILSHAKRDNTTSIFFPVYGKGGIKYYREDTSCILSSIKMKITGTLILCDSGDHGVSFEAPTKIKLVSSNIAESYSLLGSLYNIEHCCEALETGNLSISPELIDFDVFIQVDGCEYHLDDELFYEITKGSIMDNEYGLVTISIYDLIGFIENTITYKISHSSLYSSNEDYALFDNGKYCIVTSKNRQKLAHCDGAMLISAGCALYMSLSIREYALFKPDYVYSFSYVIFDKVDMPNEEYIPDEDLSDEILMELEGYMYDIIELDTIYVYTVEEFIYLAMSTSDIYDLLDSLIESGEMTCDICYTCNITVDKSLANQAVISESSTNKILLDQNKDLLYMMTCRMYSELGHKVNGEKLKKGKHV